MTSRRRTVGALLPGGVALLLLGALIAASVAPAAVDETILISRQSAADGGAGAGASSFSASVSADGRFVAFHSRANNLSTEDNNRVRDVFLRDTQTDTTTLVSRRGGATGETADSHSYNPSISADGRYVAFESKAGNLSNADNNFVTNVFVRDTQANTTVLVSRQSGVDGGAGADVHSINPSISADGRYVAFESAAYNLSTAANGGMKNIYLRDTQTNTTTLVSRATGAAGAGADDNSFNPSVSGDGQIVAFESTANNLSTADDNFLTNVFYRDTQANTTGLVSRANGASGPGSDGTSGASAVSADGRFVAFESQGNNLSGSDNNRVYNVFRRNIVTNGTTLVSRTSGGAAANGMSTSPSISPDGRFVAFDSSANNLSTADNDLYLNVFLRDLVGNTTTLVSRQSAADGGAGANGLSVNPSVSADGRFVAFESDAPNLSLADLNVTPGGGSQVRDIFLRQVLP